MIKVFFDNKMSPVLPEADVKELSFAMSQRHLPWLKEEFFEIEHGQTEFSYQVRVTLKNFDATTSYPIEVICLKDHLSQIELGVADVFLLLIDYVDVYFCEYLTNDRNVFLQLDWTQYACEGVTFLMRGFTRNLLLEKQADALLMQHGFGEYEILPISAEV